jgi:hypothetical protein
VVVALTLDQIPPCWLDNLQNGIRAGQGAGQIPVGTWASREGDGFVLHSGAHTTGGDLRQLAQRVIDFTHDVFEDQLAERREKREAERQLAARYAAVLEADQRVTEVVAEHWAPEREPILRVSVSDARATELDPHLLEDELNRRRAEHSSLHMSFRDGVFSFGQDQLQPEQVMAALDRAVDDATTTAERRAAEMVQADSARTRLLADAKAAFDDLPDRLE